MTLPILCIISDKVKERPWARSDDILLRDKQQTITKQRINSCAMCGNREHDDDKNEDADADGYQHLLRCVYEI